MAERSSYASQNSGPTGTIDVEEARVAAGAVVQIGGDVKAKSGFRPQTLNSFPGKVTATGTPNAFVHVAPFQLFLQGGRGSVAGVYLACLDAIKDINILSTPADPTNPRDDLIVAQQSDTFYGDGNSDFLVRHVVGTPAAVPADPTVTGSTDFVRLARVRVNANATTITNANITDLRSTTGFGTGINLVGGPFTVALGGITPVATLAERDALPGLYEGYVVYRADLDLIQVQDSPSAPSWRYISRPTDATVATSQTSTSVSPTDLATVGPQISLETGTTARLDLGCAFFNSGANETFMGFAVSGATSIAAAGNRSISIQNTSQHRWGRSFLVTGLNPGTQTFTAKYWVAAGTGTWLERYMIVEPC